MSNRIRRKANKKLLTVEETINEAKKHCLFCAICHEPAEAMGMLKSCFYKELEDKMGESGTMYFGICMNCINDPMAYEKVEALILERSIETIERCERAVPLKQ